MLFAICLFIVCFWIDLRFVRKSESFWGSLKQHVVKRDIILLWFVSLVATMAFSMCVLNEIPYGEFDSTKILKHQMTLTKNDEPAELVVLGSGNAEVFKDLKYSYVSASDPRVNSVRFYGRNLGGITKQMLHPFVKENITTVICLDANELKDNNRSNTCDTCAGCYKSSCVTCPIDMNVFSSWFVN